MKGQGIKLIKDGKRKRTRPRTRSKANSKHSLIVKNLSINEDWCQGPRGTFETQGLHAGDKAGEVKLCNAYQDRRNAGIVEFRNRGDVDDAIRISSDTEFKGIRIEYTKIEFLTEEVVQGVDLVTTKGIMDSEEGSESIVDKLLLSQVADDSKEEEKIVQK